MSNCGKCAVHWIAEGLWKIRIIDVGEITVQVDTVTLMNNYAMEAYWRMTGKWLCCHSCTWEVEDINEKDGSVILSMVTTETENVLCNGNAVCPFRIGTKPMFVNIEERAMLITDLVNIPIYVAIMMTAETTLHIDRLGVQDFQIVSYDDESGRVDVKLLT